MEKACEVVEEKEKKTFGFGRDPELDAVLKRKKRVAEVSC